MSSVETPETPDFSQRRTPNRDTNPNPGAAPPDPVSTPSPAPLSSTSPQEQATLANDLHHNDLHHNSHRSQTDHSDLDIDLDEEYADHEEAGNGWVATLITVLILGSLGGGWWWWHSLNTANEGGATQDEAVAATVVTVVPVRVGTVLDTSDLVGTLQAQQRVALKPEGDGRLVRVDGRSGQAVQPGMPLFLLSPRKQQAEFGQARAALGTSQVEVARYQAETAQALADLNAQQAERAALQEDLAAKQAEARLAQQDYDRISGLVTDGAIEEQQLDRAASDRDRVIAETRAIARRIQVADQQIVAARARLNAAQVQIEEARGRVAQSRANAALEAERLQETLVRAPIAGTLGDITAKVGDYVTTEDVLAEIVQNQILELRLAIPLDRSLDVAIGLPVQVTAPTGQILGTGRVGFIAPQADPTSQTVLVKVNVPNPQGRLRDGQFVNATLLWGRRPNATIVPTAAVTYQGDRALVYVVGGTSDAPIAQARPVSVGKVRGNLTEIRQGLNPGDVVVTSGLQRLFDGAAIAPKPGQPPDPNPTGATPGTASPNRRN